MPFEVLVHSLEAQCFTHVADDGTFRAWNATLGNEVAADGHHELLSFHLADFDVTVEQVVSLYPSIDPERATSADLTRPILAIPFFEQFLIIDGWHRLYRAARENVPALAMYLLTAAEAEAIKMVELPPGHGIDIHA
jgi:hypothetical protein